MIFDKNRDLAAELDRALIESCNTNKKILVEFGGDWCIWSERMFKVLESAKLKSLIQEKFIFVRCYTGEDGECSYPEHFPPPQFTAIPYFMLLDADAEIVACQKSEVFEFLWFYNRFKIHSFLQRWANI